MTENASVKVAVVIVVWNGAKWLPECLSSLRQADYAGLDASIFVVDNGSTDGSPDLVRQLHPEATVIVNEKNLGFAGGNNVGMRLALDAGAEFIYLLNQDTVVEPQFLRAATAAATSDAKGAAWQSLLLLHPQRGLINSVGNALHFLGFGYCRGYREPLAGWRAPADLTIGYASGAGVLLRSAALRQVGLFDEELFLYHEDLELCWRLKVAGWQVRLVPESKVWHKYEFSRSVSKLYLMERNRYLVLFKALEPWTLAVLLPWLILTEVGLFVAAWRGGWWREKLRVYDYFMTSAAWEKISRDRAAWRQLRRVSDRELLKDCVAVIDHQETNGVFARVANAVLPLVWRLSRKLITLP